MSTLQRHIRASADNTGWYALCGRRLYCIATRAGLFPDTGWHQPGEMGGVWAPPIKLLDGYWLALRQDGGAPRWLTAPVSWQMAADGVTLRYEIPDLDLDITRRDWIVPDESLLVMDVAIRRMGAHSLAPTTISCGFAVRSDLHSAWLGEERLDLEDGPDAAIYRDDLHAVVLRDTLHTDWSACVGASAAPSVVETGPDVALPEQTAGRGVNALLWYPLSDSDVTSLRFVIAGPGDNGADAAQAFARYMVGTQISSPAGVSALDQAYGQSVTNFQSAFSQCILESPDPQVDEAFAWSKVANRALMLDVPGLGRAPMAGMPDYPWWFGCDTAYGVLSYLPTGQGTDAAETLLTLARLSARHNPNGRVLHEIVFNGVPAGAGNLVETPLLVRALYHTYRWTGDARLLDEVFPYSLRGMLDWALGERLEAGELVPQGESIVETPDAHSGVQVLDAAAYMVEALDLLAELAAERDEALLGRDLRQRARRMRSHLRTAWWVPSEHFFGDIRASRSELEALLTRLRQISAPDASIGQSIQRIERALGEDVSGAPAGERRPWNFQYYTQALAAEAGLPTEAQAAPLLDRLESPEWTDTYGLVLDAALDRHVMTLPTGALAVGEARYGRVDAALDYIRRISSTLGAMTPGTIAEFSPEGGCFMQLWSSYGVIWPVIHHFFGLRPDVARRRLLCVPHLPEAWPFAHLSGIPVGNALLNIHVERLPQGYRVVLEISDPSWEVVLGVVSPDLPVSATLNGSNVPLRRARTGIRRARLAPPARGAALYELVTVAAPGRTLASGESRRGATTAP